MTRIRPGRLAGAVVALLLVSGAVTVVTGLPASASKGGPPVLRANPHTKLTNDATVRVRGGNFGDDDALVLLECLRGSSEPTGCDPLTATAVTANATGHIPPLNFTVISGEVGTGTCGTTSADARDCEIAANDVTKASQFVATVGIGFKPASILPLPSPPDP